MGVIHGVAAACLAGAGPAVLVHVDGLRDAAGQVRVAVYPADADAYLASGRYVERIDVPLRSAEPLSVCAPVPHDGPWVVAILHDRQADGRLSPFRDGVGFPGNPRLSLGKPPLDAVTSRVVGVTEVSVTLNYLQGLRPRPWRGAQRR